MVSCLLWFHFLKLEAEKAATRAASLTWCSRGFPLTPLHCGRTQVCSSWGATPRALTTVGALAGTCFSGKAAEAKHSSSEGQRSCKSFYILQQTASYFCQKPTYNQCWFFTLTVLCTVPQRKDLADYSLRCTFNYSLQFMQTAFPYRIFIFNLIGNCNVSTQFCKHSLNSLEASILCMNFYRMVQQKLWKRMLLLCSLGHLSFTEIAWYPVAWVARSVLQSALWSSVTGTPAWILNLLLQTTF